MNQGGVNIAPWFYPETAPSNTRGNVAATNFRINNVDISGSYTKIGTNSNISVSNAHTINYLSNNVSIGDLFELNLPVFSDNINEHYRILTPANHQGLLIQFLKSTSISFNYNISGSFAMVGGGGRGGDKANGNAGGGGGAGRLITGNIVNHLKNTTFTITIGDGGDNSGNDGGTTIISYPSGSSTILVTAAGGTAGGVGAAGSGNSSGSSGGTGSYSGGQPSLGTAPDSQTLNDNGVFQSMYSRTNRGSLGNNNNNNNGGGGG